MTAFVPIALFGWIPAVLLLFCFMQPRQAVVTGYLVAWLFLPVAGYQIAGLPDFTKMFATTVGVLLGVALFDSGRLLAFRPHWVDLPMAAWCLVQLPSSITNGLGVYDGVSEVVSIVIQWGLPYFIGRLYFTDPQSLRVLAIAIFIGGLIYVPLCLFELRMSPQLHRWIYGYHQHRFMQSYSLGSYRPMVFMQNFLMVSMWMAGATVIGTWLWIVGKQQRVLGVPMWLLVGALAFTTLLCKSVNGWVLMAAGIGAVFFTKLTRTSIALIVLLAVAPLYLTFRTTQTWSGRDLVEQVRVNLNEKKARSLEARLEQEDLFSAKAWQQPIFGWGGYGRMFPTDPFTGRRLTRGIDSLWVIALGTNGLAGLFAWMTLMLLPPSLLLWRCPGRYWGQPAMAAPAALLVLLLLYMIDCLFNGLLNPVFLLVVAALTGVASWRGRELSRSGVRSADSPREILRPGGLAPYSVQQRGARPKRPAALGIGRLRSQ